VQRLPNGRHAAGQSRRPRTRARSRKPIKTARYVWLIVLAAVAPLVAVAFGSADHGMQTFRFDSNSTSAPLFGASVRTDNLAQETSGFGHMSIIRVYYPGLPSPRAWATGTPAANRSAVIVSFKALPRTILSGQDDAALSHFFDTAPTGNPIYYSYWHEPEGNIAAGQFTLTDYKAAWAHVVALAAAAHNPDLHSTLILGGYDFNPASHRNWRDYLPGGGIISILGWDAYPVGSATNHNPQPTPPATFMGPEIAAAKSVGLPYGFAEFGLSTAVGRPAWLTEVGNYLMHSGALFASLFNGNAQYPTLQLTDPGSIAVWRSFVAKSGSSVPVPDQPPAPTPPGPTSAAPSPIPTSPTVTGLVLSPAAITANGQSFTTITFRLTQAADVTVVFIDHNGTVVRTMSRPRQQAGHVTVRYYGYNGAGQPQPIGRYQVLIVASNADGSATAEAPLVMGGPSR
jgi:FlgD Ig-like domain